MNTKTLSGCLAACLAGLLLAGAGPAALAQTPASAPHKPAAPAPDDINPGVDTSADEHQVRDTTPSSSADVSKGAASRPAPAPAPAKSGKAAAGAKKAAPGAKPADKGTDKPIGKTQDHMNLDRTAITGNSELPKVMAIVPWKRADLGDAGRPMNSLLDEVLQPIDRDVFQRQTRYYDALKPDAVAAGAGGR